MRKSKLITCLITFLVTNTKGNLIWNEPNNLHPVHGLFVKPSIDGSTGDLYVAATEENGVKSQWLADPTVNFLPASSQTTVPAQPEPQEENTKEQKPNTSPTIKYAYALPLPKFDGNVIPFPLSIATLAGPFSSPCAKGSHNQYKYLYPHILSSIANTMNSLNGASDKKESSTAIFQSSQFWPNAFSYPYVALRPSYLAQKQKDEDTSAETISNETV